MDWCQGVIPLISSIRQNTATPNTGELQKLIEAKAQGQKREAPAPKVARTNVIDLVSALQESLGKVKKSKKKDVAKDRSRSRCSDQHEALHRQYLISKSFPQIRL
jgi:hypothetical protein